MAGRNPLSTVASISALAVRALAVLAALCVLERAALADPLPYTGPWSIQMSTCTSSGSLCEDSFGLLSQNGVIAETTADSAVANAAFFVAPNLIVGGPDQARVEFNRPLTLPTGGIVCLSTSLMGSLSVSGAPTNLASVTGCAMLQNAGGQPVLTVGCGAGPWQVEDRNGVTPVAVGPAMTCTTAGSPLPAGNYVVVGSLIAMAGATASASDFFDNPSGGFVVFGTFQAATPAAPALGRLHVALMALSLAAIGLTVSRRRAMRRA
jgi:hypothetical protein